MRERNWMKFTIFSLGLSVLIISVFIFQYSQSVSGQNRILLFSLKDSPKALPDNQKNSPASVLESEILINAKNFSAQNIQNLSIPLFDGKSYTVIQRKSEGFEFRGEDDFTWRGKLIENDFRGDVVLTFYKGHMTGLIYSPKAVYEIVAKGNKQVLIELDQSLFPDCAGEIKAPESEKFTQENVGTLEDSGDRIDVLVVYTEAVKNAVGGDSQAQTLAQNAVDAANTAYINSKIRQRLRLVRSEQTALTESNDLASLRADVATQNLRNAHNADMVAMLVNSLSGCGIGYLMTSVGSGFGSSAYSITLRTCAVGNLTFAHELGHNMGSAHNPENGGSSAYSYSFGHYVNGNYRTVMSYSNLCTSGCTRVPQFSNPAVIYNDAPTGILETRNNARSIENTADTVANFRNSGSSIRLDNFSENAFIPRNITRTLNWSARNISGNLKIELSRDEGTTWETLVTNTANDGSETFSVSGRPTKRARLRVSSVDDSMFSDSSIKNLSIK